MGQSVFESDMDFEAYLSEQALKIQNLEARASYKEVTQKMILALYHYFDREYQSLEQRVFDECHQDANGYAIYIGIATKQTYDVTDHFLHPIDPGDLNEISYDTAEIKASLQAGVPYPLYRIFLQLDYHSIQEIIQKSKSYYGKIKTNLGDYTAVFSLRQSKHYIKRIEQIYHAFVSNHLSWNTVCTAYLTKLFDVFIESSADLPDNVQIETIQVDFDEYESVIVYNCVPLWNISEIKEKSSTYPDPCIDSINYQHRIFAQKLTSGCQYLVANHDVPLLEIKRNKEGDVLITCTKSIPWPWELYQISPYQGKRHDAYMPLGNTTQETFGGDLANIYRQSIKTKAEMRRIINAYGYENYVRFKDAQVKAKPSAYQQSYNMDYFLEDDFRTENDRLYLEITFTVNQKNYLTADIISFLVTQIQRLFPEYICIGICE